jgi:hypothetical protein
LSGNPRLLGIFDEGFAPFRLLDLGGAKQERIQVAIFDNERS